MASKYLEKLLDSLQMLYKYHGQHKNAIFVCVHVRDNGVLLRGGGDFAVVYDLRKSAALKCAYKLNYLVNRFHKCFFLVRKI